MEEKIKELTSKIGDVTTVNSFNDRDIAGVIREAILYGYKSALDSVEKGLPEEMNTAINGNVPKMHVSKGFNMCREEVKQLISREREGLGNIKSN